MELLWILLAILAIAAATYFRQRESMSNADVKSALQSYGTETDPKQESKASKRPIYGPSTGGIDEPVKETESKSKNSKSDYPTIYGPDVNIVPGTNPKNGEGSESYFTVNTDLKKAFPTDGQPTPYLTDFSKIQR